MRLTMGLITARSELRKVLFLSLSVTSLFFMVALCNRTDHYIFAL